MARDGGADKEWELGPLHSLQHDAVAHQYSLHAV